MLSKRKREVDQSAEPGDKLWGNIKDLYGSGKIAASRAESLMSDVAACGVDQCRFKALRNHSGRARDVRSSFLKHSHWSPWKLPRPPKRGMEVPAWSKCPTCFHMGCWQGCGLLVITPCCWAPLGRTLCHRKGWQHSSWRWAHLMWLLLASGWMQCPIAGTEMRTCNVLLGLFLESGRDHGRTWECHGLWCPNTCAASRQ